MKQNVYTIKILDVVLPEEIEQALEDSSFTSLSKAALKGFTHVFVVMQRVQSDLKHMLDTCKSIELKESHIVTIMYNMLSAVNFIHSANVLHRDIKPANLLLDQNCQVIICDFGLARS